MDYALLPPMDRTGFSGAVRNTEAEIERDRRMLVLRESGVPVSAIAVRMGLKVVSVRARLKKAAARRPLQRL